MVVLTQVPMEGPILATVMEVLTQVEMEVLILVVTVVLILVVVTMVKIPVWRLLLTLDI